MSQIIVLTPQEQLLKAFVSEVIEPIIILKGDGVVHMSPNGHVRMGFPPQHLLNPNPHQPDHPLWSWDPHTGAPLDGGMHPIDGAATHLQAFLDERGIKLDAAEVIQRAIDRFNLNHTNTKQHDLPAFESPEWRKAILGPHPVNQGSRSAIGTRGRDGLLFTHYTSKPGHTAGLFPESGAIPFNKELEMELEGYAPGLGAEANNALEFVKYPNISPQHLTPNVYRSKAGELGAHGILPSNVLERHGPEGMSDDRAYGAMHTWDTIHHLPAGMFYVKPSKYRTGATQKAAEAHLSQVLQQMDPAQIPDHPITLADGSQVSFREAVSNPEMRAALIADMAAAPAMQYMFAGGRGRGTQTKSRVILNPLLDIAGMEAHRGHASSGTGSKSGKHALGAKVAQAAAAHGPWDKDPTRSAMADHPIGLPEDMSPEDLHHLGRRRQIIESMGDMMSRGMGHRERWTPNWESLPTQAPVAAQIQNYNQIIESEVPNHWKNRFHTELTMAPIVSGEAPMPPMGAGPSTREPEPIRGPPTPPPGASLPPSRFERPAPIRGVPAATPTAPLSVEPPLTAPRPLHPAIQEARTAVGAVTPGREQRAIAQELQVPEAIHQDPRALAHFADPAQTRLDQWVRTSADQHEMLDRIEKAMEEMQLHDAKVDMDVMKYLPTQKSLNLNIESDVALMASKTGLTKHDIRSLAVSKGDWHRVAEVFKVPPPVVGAVKVVFS